MRLSKLKLAGFKSFVDPTTVLTPGQLVGVVGPNGCGKSNIIDAVRWVLGESRAGALRGDSMLDVIFNGSTTRKPVSRASVELIFDNAEGRAAGQWSSYAEIAVKRVLDRSGESSYWINNVHVRRKDVIDLFLGTGLGPRAYAIIEQGMISRIIEARPEEVRGFLEEAAGVTKYKERRRETENRLADARDNLARIEDIRNELGGQIERLAEQAGVARRYRSLNEALREHQILLWLLRRNEAQEEAARASAEIAACQARIEAENARLSEADALGAHARESHYAASDALHAAQAAVFGANAEVTRQEGELERLRERRERLAARSAQLASEAQRWATQRSDAVADRERWLALQEAAALRHAQALARHEELAGLLPAAEDALAGAQAVLRSLRHELASAEQQHKVADTHKASALRALDALAQRRNRIEGERRTLNAPDLVALARAEAAAEHWQTQLEQLQQQHEEAAAALPQAQAQQAQAQEAERECLGELTRVRARLEALTRIQHQAAAAHGPWLAAQGLAEAPVLWQGVRVEGGWEAALEAVLGVRFNALRVGAAPRPQLLAQALPAGLALSWPLPAAATGGEADIESAPGQALLDCLRIDDAAWRGGLEHWLAGVRVVDSLDAWLAEAAQLPAALCLVDRSGLVLCRSGLHRPRVDAGSHGVLERQREIEQLSAQADQLAAQAEHHHALHAAAQAQAQTLQERLGQLRRELQSAQHDAHREQMLALQASQARQRFDERSAQLARELDEIDAHIGEERAQLERAVSEQARHEALGEILSERLEAAELGAQQQDAALRQLRQQEQQLAREAQEADFSARECQVKLDEQTRLIAQAEEHLQRGARESDAAQAEQAGLEEAPLQAALQEALAQHERAAAGIAQCREALDAASVRLRELEATRHAAEQALRPLAERVGELRLQQQAAELGFAQYVERLGEIEFDPALFVARLASAPKDATLSREINRLTRELSELGAVNLAAVEELSAAEERKGYLDAQNADLCAAIGSIEDAIRRIDRETRAQMLETYNTVNQHFGELFPQLFGGGQAQLMLTGDEILDAGVQIIAQPPGKKNSTIQLLSGGEKALTAIALVFSFFRLNPAPFCILDEVDAPLDDANTVRFCKLVKRMSEITQFLFISHSKITMELALQLVGVTMQEQGVSRVVEVDIEAALRLAEAAAA